MLRKILLLGALVFASLNVAANECSTADPYPSLDGATAYVNFWETPTDDMGITFWFKATGPLVDGDGRKYLAKDTKKRWVFWEEDSLIYFSMVTPYGTVHTTALGWGNGNTKIVENLWFSAGMSTSSMGEGYVFLGDEGYEYGVMSMSGIPNVGTVGAVWPTTEFPETTFAKTGEFAIDEPRYFKGYLDANHNYNARNTLPEPCIKRFDEVPYSDPSLPDNFAGQIMIGTKDLTFTREVEVAPGPFVLFDDMGSDAGDDLNWGWSNEGGDGPMGWEFVQGGSFFNTYRGEGTDCPVTLGKCPSYALITHGTTSGDNYTTILESKEIDLTNVSDLMLYADGYTKGYREEFSSIIYISNDNGVTYSSSGESIDFPEAYQERMPFDLSAYSNQKIRIKIEFIGGNPTYFGYMKHYIGAMSLEGEIK